jgi:L-alanine-DL-glutamate epimerase-like enolase superfamily enzyme
MEAMKIARVTATPLNVPLHITLLGLDRHATLSACVVEVETDQGLVGHGFTAITEEEVIAQIVNSIAGPAIVGDDPLLHERVWDKLYWSLMPRGQTGYAAHALAAIDVALWDIKGKALGQPVWRLLGGARNRVPVYATFGFGFFARDQLAAAAKLWVSQGFARLKMTVGGEALRRRDARPVMEVIREDAARVATVRDAVGPEIELFIDANCSLDLYHATRLVEMIKPLGISFFEEPITQNDALLMAQLRRATGMPLACGQNEGLAFRFRDLLRRGRGLPAAECLHHRRLYPVPQDRGHGGCVQPAGGERRRLGFPQHASAGRRRQRHAGRAPLSRRRTMPADLPRPA